MTTMDYMRCLSLCYLNYHKWVGPENIRKHELKQLRRAIFLQGVFVRVERRKAIERKLA